MSFRHIEAQEKVAPSQLIDFMLLLCLFYFMCL